MPSPTTKTTSGDAPSTNWPAAALELSDFLSMSMG